MAATDYQYSISTDFPNHEVATDRLQAEIQASAILIAIERIDTLGDACDIWFKDVLSAGDKTLLDGIVAVHSGEPLAAAPSPVTMMSATGSAILTPQDRMLVVNFPADFGANLWVTGRGDESGGRRGRGVALRMKFADVVRTAVETKVVEIQINEQFQLHDGHIDVKDPGNWDIDDEWDLSVVMPANTATPNPTNTGNCNVVPAGDCNVIVPAAGDGAYDIDLATAIPLPSVGGGWAYDYYTNTLTPAANEESSQFCLLDVPWESFVQISLNIPFSPMGMFDFDAYDAQRISPRWKVRFVVRKSSNGPGTLAGWIVCFREQNT